MRFLSFAALAGLAASPIVRAAPVEIVPSSASSPSKTEPFDPRSVPVQLSKRAPTISFTNMDQSMENQIRDMLNQIQDSTRCMLGSTDLVQNDVLNPNSMLFHRVFGPPEVAAAVPSTLGPHGDYANIPATVLANLRNLASINSLDSSVHITFNYIDTDSPRSPIEQAFVSGENTVNLYRTFWNNPTLSEITLRTTNGQRPASTSPLDWLRNRASVLMHELLHVRGIGTQQPIVPGNESPLLDRQIPQGLTAYPGRTAYGQTLTTQLALSQPFLAALNPDNYRIFWDAIVFHHEDMFTSAGQINWVHDVGMAVQDLQNLAPGGGGELPGYELPPYSANYMIHEAPPEPGPSNAGIPASLWALNSPWGLGAGDTLFNPGGPSSSKS